MIPGVMKAVMKPVKVDIAVTASASSAMFPSSPSITEIIMSVSRTEGSRDFFSEKITNLTLGRFVVFSPKEVEARLTYFAREIGCGLLVKTG